MKYDLRDLFIAENDETNSSRIMMIDDDIGKCMDIIHEPTPPIQPSFGSHHDLGPGLIFANDIANQMWTNLRDLEN